MFSDEAERKFLMISFKLEGMDASLNNFGIVKERFSSGIVSAMKQSALLMWTSVQKNFDEQGRPDKWQEHGPLTQLIRGKDAKILEDTGALRQGIMMYVNEEQGHFGLYESGPAVEYADLMQNGGLSPCGEVTIPKQTKVSKLGKKFTVKAHTANLGPHEVPARPFMMVQDEDRENMMAVFMGVLGVDS